VPGNRIVEAGSRQPFRDFVIAVDSQLGKGSGLFFTLSRRFFSLLASLPSEI